MAEGTRQEGIDPSRWVDEHGDVLYGFALVRLRSPDLAENAVQETFLAALQAMDSFSGRSSERTWLVGILKNKIYDHFRRAAREAPLDEDARAGEPAEDLFDDRGRWKVGPADWGSAPDSAVGRAEFMEVLRRCIVDLPGKQGVLFTMKELDHVGTGEICKVLAISETNLWVMMHRARARLRRCLELNWFGSKDEES